MKIEVFATDSNYIHFPHLQTAQETWDYAVKVADEVSKLFPRPNKLDFESVIYWRFFILTKKRYMYTSCLRDGEINKKVGKKGVLLARRDNSKFVRDVYETLISMIFEKESMEDVLYFLIQEINKLCSHYHGYKSFVITKAVGDANNLIAIPFKNEKGQMKAKVGDYTVPLLSNEPKLREEQLKKKGAADTREFYLKSLPAQVQLAEKIRRRGQRVDPGTRLEYLITTQGGPSSLQSEKVEGMDYFAAHSDILEIDYMYYLKQLSNPVDQVLNVMYHKKPETPNFKENFLLNQYNYRLKIRAKVLNDIKRLNMPVIDLIE